MHWPLWRVAVAEHSMEPALRPGDLLLVWRRPWPGWSLRVKPGQLVVARHPEQRQLLLVKRAVWLEPGGWWLNSDNPMAGGVDSVRFGLVPPELIEGRVLGRYFPVRRGRGRLTRARAGPRSRTGPRLRPAGWRANRPG